MPLASNNPRLVEAPRAFARVATTALITALLLGLGAPAPAPAGGMSGAASEEVGRGSPTIVLIHSLGGDRDDWSQVVPLLSARHRVVLVDLPGHGQSPPLQKAITVAEVADAVEHALSERKVKDAILVGHSYGALVALQIAIDHGKRAAAVVAVDATTYMDADSARISGVEQMMRERYSVFLQAVYGAMSKDPLRGDTLTVRASRVNPEVLTAYFRDAWTEDARPRLLGLKTPVHVIATETLWPSAESWTSARKRLGYMTAGPAVGYRVADSGHAVMMDAPADVAGRIETIAAELSKKR